jgi:sulfoxide reductase heme-binding subunit YedZ
VQRVIGGILGTKALWYLARGTGIVSLSLLTAVLVLGIAAHSGSGARVPRFAVTLLHRNLSLLVVLFLLVHIATSVLDPFAAIAWSDAVVPLSASYRPLWLGLGALGFDLLLALAITSLLRVRLGLRTWRSIHWLAYACWPVALVHGLGTGSDVRSPWLLVLVAASVASVVVAACVRLTTAQSLDLPWRVAAGAIVLLGPLLLAGWLESGPLQPGWARHAGTPAPLLRHTALPAAGAAAVIALPRADREDGG